MNELNPPQYLFPKRYADFVQRLRVLCGFLLLLAFAWLSHPSHVSIVVGFPLAFAGLLLRAWAAGYLAKDQQLATGGPYAYVRNPLYVGTLIAAFGIVFASRSLWLLLVFAGVFLLVYFPAIELEEQHLREIFPEYRDYALRVRRFFPASKWVGESVRFSWSRYRKNEEYRALIGFAIAVAWLAWKASRV